FITGVASALALASAAFVSVAPSAHAGVRVPATSIACTQGTIDYHVYNPTQNGGGYEQTHWTANGCNNQQRPCIWDATGKAKCGGWVKAVGLKSNTPKAYGVIS